MARVGRMVKETIVSHVTTELKARPNFLIAAIGKLPAAEANVIRQKLHGTNARLLMINRRLSRKALEPLSIAGLQDLLKGSIGLVLTGDDAMPALKILVDFGKTHQEQITISGGMLDGEMYQREQIAALAALPPRPVLLAQVLGTIEAPMADVIFTIERIIGDIAWIAEQAAEKKPAPAAPAAPAAAPAPVVAEPKAETPAAPATPPSTQNPDAPKPETTEPTEPTKEGT